MIHASWLHTNYNIAGAGLRMRVEKPNELRLKFSCSFIVQKGGCKAFKTAELRGLLSAIQKLHCTLHQAL